MFIKFLEKLWVIVNLFLEYGWIVLVSLVILYFISPNVLDSLIVQLIIIIPIILLVLVLALTFAGGIGEFVFKKYSDDYERLVNEGVDKTATFAKSSLKAVIVYIALFLLALVGMYILYE